MADRLGRQIIDFDPFANDDRPAAAPAPVGGVLRRSGPSIPTELTGSSTELPVSPSPDAALPRADYLVVTWTIAEWRALARVFAPDKPITQWHAYRRRFAGYLPHIAPAAPARVSDRLASYLPCTMAGKSVLCVKSELHLNQDAIATGTGTATLPVAQLWAQLVAEVKPKLIITTGTAGGLTDDSQLGDVLVTRAAQFELTDEFRCEPFNHQTYRSEQQLRAPHADGLFDTIAASLHEPDFGPPTPYYRQAGVLPGRQNKPRLLLDGRDFPAYRPIMTTDTFRFGVTGDGLDHRACAIEMGDAALGLALQPLGTAAPRWLVVRNVSTPRINSALSSRPDVQGMWAFFYYSAFGYYTSLCSALASAALIAADTPKEAG